ncbi:30S ribosomal protein S18 [Saccharopolyspora sp. NPDC049426]|uniref:30S ribosomal protein S18 n=1 Tax=Saccharopolyspora sp. NPDC049426 TaxID=3155652 RepID=UPI00343780F7
MRRPVERRRKPNLLQREGVVQVDWKDVTLLRKFISDRGKIRSRRVTGLTAQEQREVAKAIKNAREMALLPYHHK